MPVGLLHSTCGQLGHLHLGWDEDWGWGEEAEALPLPVQRSWESELDIDLLVHLLTSESFEGLLEWWFQR